MLLRAEQFEFFSDLILGFLIGLGLEAFVVETFRVLGGVLRDLVKLLAQSVARASEVEIAWAPLRAISAQSSTVVTNPRRACSRLGSNFISKHFASVDV